MSEALADARDSIAAAAEALVRLEREVATARGMTRLLAMSLSHSENESTRQTARELANRRHGIRALAELAARFAGPNAPIAQEILMEWAMNGAKPVDDGSPVGLALTSIHQAAQAAEGLIDLPTRAPAESGRSGEPLTEADTFY